jgi:hypothetical protein
MPRTVLDILNRSARLIGVLETGETLSANEAADALLVLNQMLDAWKADRLFAYSIVERTHPLVAGTAAYTIGLGGNINVERPVKIEYAFTRDSQNYDRSIAIIPDAEFALITLKSLPLYYPTALKYQPEYPLGIVTLWPPPISALTLHLGCWQPLSEFSGYTDPVTLPPGYEEAIVFSLGERLAGEYGKSMNPSQIEIAKAARARIQGANLPDSRMHCEFQGVGSWTLPSYYDIASGNY